MQRDISKEHMVKISSYQKVLAASEAGDLPKLGRGHTRMLLTWQGMVDLVDLLAGKEQRQEAVSAEKVLDWVKSADALPRDVWDMQHAYDGSASGGDDEAGATQEAPGPL